MSLSKKLSIANVDVQGKRVLIRVDFNVPQDQEGKITNPAVCQFQSMCYHNLTQTFQRIVAALPTIKYVLEKGLEFTTVLQPN